MPIIARAARRSAAVAALTCGGVSVAALLAACGSVSGQSGSQPSVNPGGPASSVSSAPASSSPASAAGSATPQCPTSALTAAVAATGGGAAAGSVYVPVNFTNVSSHSCVMFGFPGVSWVTGMGGSQIGAAATRQTGFGSVTVTLAPGGSAHAWLQIADAGNFPSSSCHPVTAHELRIYPPDQFTSLYAAFTSQVCSAKVTGGSTPLAVLPVRAGHGTSGQVP